MLLKKTWCVALEYLDILWMVPSVSGGGDVILTLPISQSVCYTELTLIIK